MSAQDRLLIWLVGFLAGFAAAAVGFGGGPGGGWFYDPVEPPPPPGIKIPDTVPDWLSRVE
jgi:hypothetical protein